MEAGSLVANGSRPLLATVLPEIAEQLRLLLLEKGRDELAAQVQDIRIFDRCRCGVDGCGSFQARPQPGASYADEHLCVWPHRGMILLNIFDGRIGHVEITSRPDVHDVLAKRFP
jgi:hypothetical protein